MKNSIKTYLGISCLLMVFVTNVAVSANYYGIKHLALPDFFFLQCNTDRMVDHREERDQKCKVGITINVEREAPDTKKAGVIFRTRRITVDETW